MSFYLSCLVFVKFKYIKIESKLNSVVISLVDGANSRMQSFAPYSGGAISVACFHWSVASSLLKPYYLIDRFMKSLYQCVIVVPNCIKSQTIWII